MKARESVDDQVLAKLALEGTQDLQQLSSALPTVSWVQLVLALDRLSRTEHITVWRSETGQYWIGPTHDAEGSAVSSPGSGMPVMR